METEPDVIAMDWEVAEMIENGTGGSFVQDCNAPDARDTAIQEKSDVADLMDFCFDSSDDEDNLDFGTSVAPIVEVSTGFDMKILQQAIETSTESLDLVAGKDVVLIAGKTGVGKSTLMQGIAGKHIISCKREATVSGQTAMKTVFEAEDPLPSFEIGHAKKSKTRSLNAFLRRDAKGNDIVYLDSPGLDDTGGIEIDIATSAVLSQVSKRCKSLKFVILIHCASLLEDRGGAFRTVLKFARTFVQDFDESKMSFTFLFTHSDEIASMTASISDARKRLQEEIILTYEGTTDPNVLSVLSFIRKSLKKGYPFADIFHPLKMDFSKFVDSVENQLTQVTDLDSARVCNLTLSSKLRLESAVQNLLRQLRLALKELSVDVCKVKDIESRLHFLGRYIEVACVRQATIECDKIISDYVSTLKESIDNQINLGLSPDVDFSDNNSISLKDGLRELDAISGHLSSESRKVKIERGLEKLQQEIISRANNDVAFHKELHRLRVWTRAFPQFGSKYKSTLDELRKFLDNISDEVRDVDFTNLQTMSQNDLSSFVTRFFKLHDICEYLALFPINDISIEKANEVRDHAMDSLSSTLEVWSLSAAEIADPKNTIDHNFDLEVTAKSSHVLEYIHHVIEHRERESAHITKGVVGTMERLEEAVVVRFTDYCMQLSGSQFSYDWEVQFLWARGVCNQFSSLRRERWRRLPEAFDSVINNAKSILYKMSRDLQSKSSYLKEQGMREGKSLAQSFLHLKNSQWFDSILPPDHSFVSRDCTKIESAIKSRFDKISISAEKCFKNLPTPQINSPENINKIGLLLPEFKEFESYSDIMYPSSSIIQQALATTESNIDGGKLQYSKRCVEELEKYTDFLGDLSNKYCVVFVEAYHSGRFGCVRSLSRKLNLVLSLADSLQSTDASLAVIQKSGILIQNIEEKCVLLSSHINSEFSSFAGDFNRKAALFTTLKEICTVFTRISEYLPDFKKIQLELRDLISSEALSIEDEMEASSNWEEIDKKLVHFKAAHVLDEISRNEVTRNLTSLLRQRDQKEVQVDGLLQEMIRENNFRGISEFIAPYHKSHDQIKQQKFRMYQREIGSSLEVIIHQTYRILDVETLSEESLIRQASINMAIVKDAKCELQALLLERLNLQSEIRKLHQKTSTISNAFIKKMYHAMGSKDFVQLARVEKNANAFHLHMENHLHLSIKKKLNDVTRKSKSAVDEIPKYLEQVFSSEFKSVEDFSESMSSLREASEMNDDATVGHLIAMYEKMKADIAAGILRSLRIIKEAIAETQCIDDVMPIVHAIKRQLNGPLQAHCSTDLLVECESVIEHMREIKKNHDTQFDFSGGSHVRYFDDCLKKLDKLKEFSWRRWSPWWHSDKRTYENFRDGLRGIVERRYNQARDYLNARDFVSVQECIDFLKYADERIRRHVAIVKSRLDDLQTMCVKHYLTLCDKAKQLFLSGKSKQFKELFADYRGFVLHIPCVLKSPEGKKEFSLINQLLFESLEKDVSKVKNLADEDICNFKLLRSQVLRTRDLGSFYADRLTLLHEELNCCPHSISEIWLEELHSLCWKHFFHGRDLSNIKHCAFLGVTPSATEAEINRAYRDIAKRYHPDKVSTTEDDNGSKFRKAKEAREALLKNITQSSERTTQAFDEELIAVGVNLHNAAKKFMMEQRYDQAEKLLFSIPQMRLLDDLVDPGLDSDGVVKSIYKTIKGYIEKVRIEVDSHWSGRKYKELNDSITDLKEMELHFKAYPQIFPASWDKGIIKSIEREIELLSEKANTCLQSHHVAKQKEAEFRRCFIDMGFVLVELPSFKDFTKSVMSNVLEKCLDADWGYSYLFELGLSLQRGDESSNETENRVAQMLVSEFNHFKEVITMTWNQETSQKPAKDVVAHIKGEHRKSSSTTTALFTDHELLLDTYNSFDQEYKSFLGEYIRPEADLKALAHKILDMAEKMKPFDCDSPLRDEVKQNIPILLAGVFSLFTILKSGASYNRISESSSSSDLGEKILMKPHNIQVLTILFMLGCGRESNSHLDSQLMEIRTGEGKSMILGAAATMLGLLGFSVRTVCYSEYLSSRDFKLFEEVFDHLKLTPHIKYSKITTYAEDCTAEKGDIRALTGSLLRGTLKRNNVPKRSGKSATFSLPQPRVENSIITLGDSRSMSNNFKHIDEVEPCTSSAIHTSDEKVNNSYSTDKTLGTSALAASPYSRDPSSCDDSKRREILLVDEVDVFFGSEFYGQTYNQVVDYKEPEIEEILRRVWNSYHQGGQCMNLSDVQSMPEYSRLLGKMPTFSYLLENEVSLMLDQMKKVDDVPYYIDSDNNRIGYKVMDTISYEATYGYATVFAYLKESANMKKSNTISQVLAMPISCGQFSYANISPYRILGVSGTLQALGEYEKSILSQYGLNKFIYVPSVYGSSNFQFDKAGDGIYFEENTSNFFHRISAEIIAATKSRRAVIVFFQNRSKLDMFVSNPIFHQLGRNKKLLTEDMEPNDKEYVISKAATSGQITICTAVFGRGTDFFCKDEGVQNNGGVHIIQTFLSEQISEEIQIQGRTARQGKRGSYQMVLLESDLVSDFGVAPGEKDKIPKKDLYDWLCKVRLTNHGQKCKVLEENLKTATEKDSATRTYFDALLEGNSTKAERDFIELYQLIKKPPFPTEITIDLALAIDSTGSMAPYAKCITSTIEKLLTGQNSLVVKLTDKYPEIDFAVRVGCLSYRDIDDKSDQFKEAVYDSGCHFSNHVADAVAFVKKSSKNFSGGSDLAEDHIGAIHHCATVWNHEADWISEIKCILLVTDAPAHGFVPPLSNISDDYNTRHPLGLTFHDTISKILSKGIDLFLCSFNPCATYSTEEEASLRMRNHPDNTTGKDVLRIPMVPVAQVTPSESRYRHIIFVLDESGSMQYSWTGVISAYNQYISKRQQSQCVSDLVSVVQFNDTARVTERMVPLSSTHKTLSYHGGGTCFYPAALEACQLARNTPHSHYPVIIFMSDGQANDADSASREFSVLNDIVSADTGDDLELHVISFGNGTDVSQLQMIARASKAGKVHCSADVANLATIFVNIATNQDVATLLEAEIAKRISDAVSDKISLEYFSS